ncbi:MAG: DUF2357 domain-containing protein [Anaerolineales bacterium]|nr:DUF2357 domain-containing protein [Anaerolineales bacterium]
MLLEPFDPTLNFVKQHDFTLADKIVTLRPAEARFNKDILIVPLLYQPNLGQIAIYEWTEYLLEGQDLQNVALSGTNITRLKDNLYRFQLKNRTGYLRLNITLTDHSRHVIPLSVLSRKYPTPAQHLDFFQILLNDLVTRSAVLPFDVTQPTHFAADESPEPPTPIFVYHFLRQYGPQLEAALETILNNPHRTLIDHDELVPLDQAIHADAAILETILAQPQFLSPTRRALPIAQALRGYVPTHLWQPLAEETFDTPPNRFAKQFLTELADRSARLAESWLAPYLTLLEAVRDKLAFTQLDPLWQEVGSLTHFPAENQTLLKRHGYRAWADLWRRFHLARLPVWRQLEEAIDARDIAALYEMWCFFALADKLGETLGVPPGERSWRLKLSDEKGLGYTSEVIFGQTKYRLRYNQTFHHGQNRSYSITLRPDFTLHLPNGLRLVFDAKFRFEQNAFDITDEPDDEDNNPAVQRTAKQADLYKMHTYRDALGVLAAITLYPGDRDVFYHTNAAITEYDWTTLINGQWKGIGAVGMKPEARHNTFATQAALMLPI